MKLSAKQIIEICNGELVSGSLDTVFEHYSHDTRTIKSGDIYIGIQGENLDGNDFIDIAFEKGAIGCITNRFIKKIYENKTIIKVENTLIALQKLATFVRAQFNIPVIAITGSVGKTSTKDIVANVLNQKFNVLKTEGNYNNHIGLPMTLLKLENHTAVVVEMGMNHFNEISVLTNIAKPTIAVITNIGTSHIGNLGSRENILKAKLEILNGLPKDGTIIINNDNDLLNNWAQHTNNLNILTYGIENKSDFVSKNIQENNNESKYEINIEGTEYNIRVPVIGKHFIYNSLCAIAVGSVLNIEPQKIINGIREFKLTSKRMDFRKIKNNITVLADYYNASYDSMKSALEVVKNYTATRRIAVLGDMLELGVFSEQLHSDVGREVYNNDIDILITVGSLAKHIAKMAETLGTKQIYICENNKEAIKILNDNMKKNDLILLKASNGMNFGEILENIQ